MSSALVEKISAKLSLAEIKAIAHGYPCEYLTRLFSHPDNRVAWNAAWALTHKTKEEILSIPQDLLIDSIPATNEPSQRRLMLSLILRQPIEKDNIRTDFLNFCLSHMVAPEEPVGNQAFCMKLAHRMCQYYPELIHEFQEYVKLIDLDHCKPAILSVLQQIKKADSRPALYSEK